MMQRPSLSEQCDYRIREAEGGWILEYPQSWEIVEGEKVLNYPVKVFTSESGLAEFLLNHLTKFKIWRAHEILEYKQSSDVGGFDIEDVKLPKKGNRK